MELSDAIRKRRSVRKYNDIPVSDDEISEMIEAAICAPSACNYQLWKFIVINDMSIIHRIQQKGGAYFLRDVRQAIVVVYDNQSDNLEYMDYIESASAAIQNMILKATELDIGTCWVNNLPNKRVMRRLLKIPKWYDPIAMVTMGHYLEMPRNMERKFGLEDVMSYNVFDFCTDRKSIFRLTIRRWARIIYKLVPCKSCIYGLAGKLEKKFDN